VRINKLKLEIMENILLVTAILVWFFIGVAGCVYWYSKDYDVTTDQLGLMIACGLIGVFSWGLGFLIHGSFKIKYRTFFKKRT
tara:strand:+ start:283 stop:531 length:249 start_codon:yes stop_codon:yes gene_type:complete